MVGRTLGHYEILEPLGAGGMGEVYRAHDTTLKRDVAIKVLPEELAADPDRLARLEREAQLLAALNHPNIASIYGLEEVEAEDGTCVRFMALELVEGESLAERLFRGRIEPEKALGFARQIAEALEAAHAKGIIHRDLKPGNVLVTPEGQAKALDFGLAKSSETEQEPDGTSSEPPPDITRSPTVAATTRAGVILGTAAYMSPEQARGMPLDRRTDIWSFGCVLYEMLTGRRPFEGETVTDVLAAIVEREPDWDAVPSRVPPLIHVLLRRCLEKDPHERLHHIADARIEIVRAISEPAESLLGASAVVAQPPLWRLALPWGLAAVAIVVAALSFSSRIRPSEDPGTAPATTRFVWNLPEGQRVSVILPLAISRDGRQVVYAGISEGEQRLFLRFMDQLDVVPIAGTEGADAPFFSPDGERIGFAVGDNLYTMATSGGPPLPLTSYSGSAFAGASWGTDGNIVFSDGSLWSVPETGGVPTLLAEPDSAAGEGIFVIPQHLPGERSVLFLDMGYLHAAPNRIVALSLDSGERSVLIEPGGQARYLPTGHLLYAIEESLWAVPFDASALELRGQPAPAVSRVQMFLGAATNMAISDEGTLIYTKGAGEEFAIRLERRDSQGVVEHAIRLNRPGTVWTPRLSPDERTIAFGLEETEGHRTIWTLDVEREVFSLLTPDHNARSFEWSPDGKWIYYSSDESGDYEIWRRRADASGPPELVLEKESHQLVRSISPDGEWLLFAETDTMTTEGADIGSLSLTEESDARLLLESEASESSAKFSSGGRWIAYTSDESGQREVYVRSFPDLGPRIQISSEGGREPVWSRDGEQLFYRREFDLMAVDVEEGPRFSAGPPYVVLPRGLFFSPYQRSGSYDVTRNGRFLLLNYGGGESQWATGESFIVVLNWFEELKRLVPTGQ